MLIQFIIIYAVQAKMLITLFSMEFARITKG